MPEGEQQKHSSRRAKRVLADLTDAQYRDLELIAESRGISLEEAASDLVREGIWEHARRVSGQSRISSSVVAFHRTRWRDT